MQIIATGSSVLIYSKKFQNRLPGPEFSVHTLSAFSERNKREAGIFLFGIQAGKTCCVSRLSQRFGLNEEEAKERLNEISANYLYKDILKFEGLKKIKRYKKSAASAGSSNRAGGVISRISGETRDKPP